MVSATRLAQPLDASPASVTVIDREMIEASGVYNPTFEDELDVHLGFTRSEMGVQLHFLFPPEERDVTTDYQFLRWTHSEGSADSWYLQFSRDHYDSGENTRIRVSDWLNADPEVVPYLLDGRLDQFMSFNNFSALSRRYDLEFQHFWSPVTDARLAWGAGYRWDELEHFLVDQPDAVTSNTPRLFGNLEWRLSDTLLLNFGAMLEHSSMAVIYALDGHADLNCPEQPLGSGWCYRVDNFMDYRVSGIEAQLMFRTSSRSFVRLHYAYADVDGTVPFNLRPASRHDLARTVPRYSAGLLLGHQFPRRWEASLAWYLTDDTEWYADGGLVDGYSRVDLRFAKGFRAGHADGKLELILQNLGAEYEEFTPLNRFETRVMLRAGFQFH